MRYRTITTMAVATAALALSAVALGGVFRGGPGNDPLPGSERADLIRGGWDTEAMVVVRQ